MKPLSEMTDTELREWIDCAMDRNMVAMPAVDELLRRKERETIERCAAVLDGLDNPVMTASSPKPHFSLADIARVIRELS